MALISVIIPMRNAEPFVRAAVDSVLSQRGAAVEVIVVDDGSTDRSAYILREMSDDRIRIIPGPQKGISAAFNAGLAEAKGEYLARCDADDLYPPDRLVWQLAFLQHKPEFGAVSGTYSTMTAQGRVIAEQNAAMAGADVTAELRRGRGRSHVCAYLFRTALLRQLGGCREFFVTAEDVDLQFRFAEIASIWYEPRHAYLYRLHDASITHVQRSAERTFFEQCARRFQQQRQETGKDDLDRGEPPPLPKISENDAGAAVVTSSKQQVQRILLGQAWQRHGEGARSQAIQLGLRAWMADPKNIAVLRSVAALLLKRSTPGPTVPDLSDEAISRAGRGQLHPLPPTEPTRTKV